MECGFPDIFSRHIYSTVAETIVVTNYAANVQKITFEAAEMILGPWNQQMRITGKQQMQSKFTLRRSFSKPMKYAVHPPCFKQTKCPISKRSDFSPCDNIWTGMHSNFLSAKYFAAVTILFYNTSIVFRLLTDETTLSLHPGDVETGAQSITVQTFPNPLSKLEDTVLASLTDGYDQVERQTLPPKQIVP